MGLDGACARFCMLHACGVRGCVCVGGGGDERKREKNRSSVIYSNSRAQLREVSSSVHYCT